jgi:ribosome biogenesis protein BRX1
MGKKAKVVTVEPPEPEPESAPAASSSKAVTYAQVARRTTHTKKKLLVLSSRGVTAGFVELMDNLLKLLPHAKKEPKFDKSAPIGEIAEIAELAGCRAALYFEARKMKDLYLWVGACEQRGEQGPSAKFLISRIRPLRDMRLTGNCLLGSRPILSFAAEFDGAPHGRVLRQLLTHTFSPPKGHPRSKPFHDHVLQARQGAAQLLTVIAFNRRHYRTVVAPR